MILVYGSTNKGKYEEVSRGVSAFTAIKLLSLESMHGDMGGSAAPRICESGSSYEANALKKAKGYSRWCNQPTIADDTGLEISELRGLPGLYTARFGMGRVIELCKAQHSSAAQFVCCMCYAEPNGRTVSVTQALEGDLNVRDMQEGVGSSLPFSHFFTPLGEQKNLYELVHHYGYRSHRGRALETLLSSIL